MRITKTAIDGALLLEPVIHEDARGRFSETYAKRTLAGIIDVEFVQDNESLSTHKGTIRGLHLQLPPHAQSKLIRCAKGAIQDVIIDIRKNSPTYLQVVSVILSEENGRQLFAPRGCLHGFISLTDDVLVNYKVDDYYAPACDRAIRWNDPTFKIDWGCKDPILSDKDAQAPFYDEKEHAF